MGMGYVRSKFAKSSLLVLIVAVVGVGVVQGAGASGQNRTPPQPKGMSFKVLVHLSNGRHYDATYVVTSDNCSASQSEADSFASYTRYSHAFRLTSKGKLTGSPTTLGTVLAPGDARIEGTATGSAPGCGLNTNQLCKGDENALSGGPDDTYDPALGVIEDNNELHLLIDTIRGMRIGSVTGSGSPNANEVCQSTYDGTQAFQTARMKKLMFQHGHKPNIFTVRIKVPTKDLLHLKPGQSKRFSINSDKPEDVAVKAPNDCNETGDPSLSCTMTVHWEGSVDIERVNPKPKKRSK
jgi:hypothetical protein